MSMPTSAQVRAAGYPAGSQAVYDDRSPSGFSIGVPNAPGSKYAVTLVPWNPSYNVAPAVSTQNKPSTARIVVTGSGGELYLPPESIAGVVPPGSQVLVTVDEVSITAPTGQTTVYPMPTDANTQQLNQKIIETNQQVAEFNKKAAAYEANPTEDAYRSLVAEKAKLDSKAKEVSTQAVLHNAMVDMKGNIASTSKVTPASGETTTRKKNWRDALRMVWQGVTPWDESARETFYENKYFGEHSGKITGWDVIKGAGLFTTFQIPGVRTYILNKEGNPTPLENAYMVLADIAILTSVIQGTLGQDITPPKVNALRQKLVQSAREVNSAQKNLARVTDSFDYQAQSTLFDSGFGADDVPRYSQAAAKLQEAQQVARVADQNFMEYFRSVKEITPEQLAMLEEKTRIPGLRDQILEVSKKYRALENGWKELDNFELGTEGYVQKLTELQGIKNSLDSTMADLGETMKPVYSYREPTTQLGKFMESERGGVSIEYQAFKAIDEQTGRVTEVLKPRYVNKPEVMTLEKTSTRWGEEVTAWFERAYNEASARERLQTMRVATPATEVETVAGVGVKVVTRAATSTLAQSITQAIVTEILTKFQEAEITLTQPQVQEIVDASTQVANAAATKVSTEILTANQVQEATLTQLKEATLTDVTVDEATQTLTDTLTEVMTQTQTDTATKTKTLTDVMTDLKDMTDVVTTRARGFKIVGLPPGVYAKTLRRSLTPGELTASMSWKQGWDYKLWHPPFGPTDVIDSKTPFPGVPMLSGPRSAYNSLVARGDIPPYSAMPMGVFDVVASSFESPYNRGNDEAELRFVRRPTRRPKPKRRNHSTSPQTTIMRW